MRQSTCESLRDIRSDVNREWFVSNFIIRSGVEPPFSRFRAITANHRANGTCLLTRQLNMQSHTSFSEFYFRRRGLRDLLHLNLQCENWVVFIRIWKRCFIVVAEPYKTKKGVKNPFLWKPLLNIPRRNKFWKKVKSWFSEIFQKYYFGGHVDSSTSVYKWAMTTAKLARWIVLEKWKQTSSVAE